MMERRRKALEAGESVNWVDQDTRGYQDDADRASSDPESDGDGYRDQKRDTWEYGTSHGETSASETVPVETTPAETVPAETTSAETAPVETVPETTTAAPETTAVSGTLTPETKTPAYLQGPGFEDPDNPRNQN